MDNDITIDKVRAAIKDRALYLALLLRSFSKSIPSAQVEASARKAIFEYGLIKGKRDNQPMTPETWVDSHVSKGSAAVFKSSIIKAEETCEQRMTFCPLVEAWKELGCSEKEIDLLCDIAMEGDRGRAAFHAIPLEITQRLAKGDPYCCLVLQNTHKD